MPKKRTIKGFKVHRQDVGKCHGKGTRFKDLEEKLRYCLIGRKLDLLEEMRQKYDNTENPLYAWLAYMIARKNSSIKVTTNGKTERPIKIPHWVLKYFDDTANVLLDPNNNANSDIPALLGFRGRGQGSLFKRFWNDNIKEWAVAETARMLREGADGNKVFENVAKEIKKQFGQDYSPRTVRNWYDQERPS
ncbi:MAG: hypothetical protein K9K65_09150 [Desulfarculaceae bacterium]|nr:hypothetical protein [Desulfarculaceae bacterium]MCF8049551.1 hypothetical protein [Desulfarculaceae bacterium]MCF8097995.1 hypothetical protein [Desulfarculaceae bacterium]MCF8123870.1 hypothetical protein [Desulfarculaceae bacterium]